MNGTAIHWFWHQDRIVTAFGVWARDAVPLWAVKGLTYGTLGIEHALPFLILSPFFRTWTRRLAFLFAVGLHGGIAASARLGPFSYVMCIYFFILLGEDDWALVTRWFGRDKRRRTVIYDSDCGICLWTCRVLKRLDPFERLTFIGNHESDKIPSGIDSETVSTTVVVVDPATSSVHVEERAVYEAVKVLPFGVLAVAWLRVPGLSWLGKKLYRAIASRRLRVSAWFGLGVCGVPSGASAAPAAARGSAPQRASAEEAEGEEEGEADDGDREDAGDGDSDRRWRRKLPPVDPTDPHASPLRRELRAAGGVLREGVAAVLFVALASQATIENRGLAKLVKVQQPRWMRKMVDLPRLYQGWRMFAPEPPYDDGRVVVDGRTVDGRKIDPFTGEEPDLDPYTATGWGHDQFMCDYHNRIRFPGHAGNRQHLKLYLQKWHHFTGRPNDRLVAFDVWWVNDKSPPPGQRRGEPLPPQKLLSFGRVLDSGATPFLKKRPPRQKLPPAAQSVRGKR